MIRGYVYILILIAILVGGCSEDKMSLGVCGENETVSATVYARLPELEPSAMAPHSRDFVDSPDVGYLEKLYIHVFVFDESGTLVSYVRPSSISDIGVDMETKTKTLKFNVSDLLSGTNRILHIIATGIDDLSDPAKVTGGENIRIGADENVAIAGLVTKNCEDAYWARVEMPVLDGNNDIRVKLLRNFAKIVVEYSGSENDFVPTGYSVVNRPDRGTIAPFSVANNTYAEFFDKYLNANSYQAVIESGYKGIIPADAEDHLLTNELEDIAYELDNTGIGDPVYMYERPQIGYFNGEVSDRVTCVILKGRYKGSADECYYKIDIGDREGGMFRYMDLLRNFQYTINISEVRGCGWPSLEKAVEAPASNNLSASIATKDLFSVGSAGHTIEVSETTAVLTTEGEYTLKFRYTLPSDRTFDPSHLMICDASGMNERIDVAGTPKSLPGLSGNVIRSAELSGPGSDGWYTLTIIPNDVPAVGYFSQNILIFYDAADGLSRTVRLLLRQPWNLTGLIHNGETYANGMDIAEISTVTGGERRQNMNLFFHLPGGLGEALFPLDFVFESDKQNIYAHPEGPLIVNTLPKSGFMGGSTHPVIAWRRRVEWEEYSAYSKTGLWIINPFLYSSTSREDMTYPTLSVDRSNNPDRLPNDGTSSCAVRISNLQGYFSPVIDNIDREVVFDPFALSWSGTAVATMEMPSTAAIIGTAGSSYFTLYYRLSSGIPETYFEPEGMTVNIHSGISMNPSADSGFNLTGSGTDFTQTITYQEYVNNNGVFFAPFTLGSGSGTFDINVSSDKIPAASSTVRRGKYPIVNLRFDGREYSPTNTMPSSGNNKTTLYDKTANTVFTVYYQMEQGIAKEYFGESGLEFTISCTQSYLTYDTSGNRPFNLTISEDAKTATQTLTYEQYMKNTLIVAPFCLPFGKSEFTITISGSIINDKSQKITRRN